MNANWGRTETGMVFHSFDADGIAICRKSIKAAGESVTETKVDEMLAEAWGIRVQGYSKCERCATKEAAGRDRLAASMAPSTGEGDYLSPAAERTEFTREEADAKVAELRAAGVSEGVLWATPEFRALMADKTKMDGVTRKYTIRDETPEAPAPCGSVDEELRLLRKVVRAARPLREERAAGDLAAALDEYDTHMSACEAGKDRTWVLSPDNIVAVDDALDAHGVPAKGYWTFTGTDTVCTGLKIGSLPIRVARYGDTVTVRHDGTWTITPAEPRVLVV